MSDTVKMPKPKEDPTVPGLIVGIGVFIIALILLLLYGLPTLRDMSQDTDDRSEAQIRVTLPGDGPASGQDGEPGR